MRHILALACAMLLPAATAVQAEQTLVFASASSERSPISTKLLSVWVDRINADGAGIIQIDFRPGTALANAGNFYDRVSDGVVDMSWGILTQVSGQFQRLTVMELPFMVDTVSTEDIMPFSLGLWELYNAGMFDEEFRDVVPLFLTTFAQSPVHLRAPLENLDDLAGMRIIGGGATYAASLAAVGGVPLSILASDSYEAVQRGTADGRIMSWTGIPAFRFDEITKFHLEAPLGTAPGAVIINRATWEGLTPEARDIIMRNSGEALVREVAEFWIDETTSVRQAMIDAGHTVVSPSPEQLANWRERTSPIREAWVAATPDGADVMERLNNFVADYRGNR